MRPPEWPHGGRPLSADELAILLIVLLGIPASLFSLWVAW